MLKRKLLFFLLLGPCLGLQASTPTSTATYTPFVAGTPTSTPSNTPAVTGTETQTPTYTPTVSFTPSCGGPILQWSGIVCSSTASTSMASGSFSTGNFGASLLLVRVECGSGVLPSSVQFVGQNLSDSGSHVATYAGGTLATYYLVQPSNATGNLILNFPSAGEHLNVEVEIYSSVNPVNPIGAISSASGSSQIFSTALNTLASGSVLDDFLAIQNVYSDNEMSSIGSGQSSAGDVPGCCEEVYGNNKLAGAEGAYSMTYDLSQSVPYTSQLIEIEANNCGTPTRTPTLSPSFTISASPTSTFIVSSTSTPSLSRTSTQTNTPLPVTGTLTSTPTDTPTETVTELGGSATSTPTYTPPVAGSATSTPTYTPPVAGSATSTPTHTPLVAGTATSTPSYTPPVTGTPTSTPTVTSILSSGTSTPVVHQPSPITPVPVHRLRIGNNPFRPMQGELISICFDDDSAEPLQILIYSRQGHLIQTLGVQANNGSACVSWDGRDSRGSFASSGIFLVEIKGNQWFSTAKIVLIK